MKLKRFEALLYPERVVTNSQEPLRVYLCRLTLAYGYVISKWAALSEFELDRLSKSRFEAVQIYTTVDLPCENKSSIKKRWITTNRPGQESAAAMERHIRNVEQAFLHKPDEAGVSRSSPLAEEGVRA
jgi:hypothetical protein